jgi:predicted DNA-binding transcriptional regulator YafY
VVAGGGTRLTLQVDDPALLVSWVLGLGRSAEVIEPQALRDQVQRELEATLATYDRALVRPAGKRK